MLISSSKMMTHSIRAMPDNETHIEEVLVERQWMWEGPCQALRYAIGLSQRHRREGAIEKK